MTHWNSLPASALPPDLSMLMGRLLERTETVVDRLDRIDHRLQTGDARMDEIAERIARLEAAKVEAMPAAERLIKAALPYGIGLAALLGTGSIDAAVKIITALGGK